MTLKSLHVKKQRQGLHHVYCCVVVAVTCFAVIPDGAGREGPVHEDGERLATR